MNVFGLELKTPARFRKAINSIYTSISGVGGYPGIWNSMFGSILEPFAGAWQRNIVADSKENILRFSAVYTCVGLISEDIAKLRLKLMEYDAQGIGTEIVVGSPFLPVLRKPNPYQTRIQFLTYWLVSKLLWGNTYVYKELDGRGMVVGLYVLDPRMTTPAVSSDGEVFYQVKMDPLSKIKENIIIPADRIIHDRCVVLFHPLVGVGPIYAAGASATQGMRIQANSAKFFENMSRPGGILSSDSEIKDTTAERLKRDFERSFGGGNLGRLLVAGDGLTYTGLSMPASDSQLIEQLKWTVEDVARCFRVPLHKLATGQNPKFTNFASLNQDYYSQALQIHIESIEELLYFGLKLNNAEKNYGIELDLNGLLRMDPLGRAEVATKGIASGWLAPNEQRALENYKPVEGGEFPMQQQQYFPLPLLATRDASVFEKPAAPAPAPVPEEKPKSLVDMVGDEDEDEDDVDSKEIARLFLDRIANLSGQDSE